MLFLRIQMVVVQDRCVQLLPFIAGSRHDLPLNRMELIRQQIAHELVAVHHFEHPAGILIRELPI